MADEKKETKKRKKMNTLDLAEIDAKLAECREKQGSLTSKYARQLQARKKALGRLIPRASPLPRPQTEESCCHSARFLLKWPGKNIRRTKTRD